jgi:MFS family permease
VLSARVAVQYMLYLPAGAVTDAIGPARAGALACALRAAGFALLGAAGGLGDVLCAAVVLAVGGALFHPAAQSLLARVAPASRSRGFAAYVIAGQVGAVVGPPVGLVLLAGGFGLLSAVTAGMWSVAAVLFMMLRPERRTDSRADGRTGARMDVRRLAEGVSVVLQDRSFLLLAVTAAPSTLLADQVVSLVPLKEIGAYATTLFFCVVAVAMAVIQPWCASGGRSARPWVLRAGLLCAGACYLVLLSIPSGGGPVAVLLVAAVLHGLACGLTQAALFQAISRRAPSERFGAYFGLLNFLSGAFALAGGFAVGHLLDAGHWGETMALIGLGVVAVISAAAIRVPRYRADRGQEASSEGEARPVRARGQRTGDGRRVLRDADGIQGAR